MHSYRCEVCDYNTNSKGNYTRHMNVKPHLPKTGVVEKASAQLFYCTDCVYGTPDKSNYEKHLKSAKNIKRRAGDIIVTALPNFGDMKIY